MKRKLVFMFSFSQCAENNLLAFECAALKYKELIFRLSLGPHTVSKAEVAAPAPIRVLDIIAMC